MVVLMALPPIINLPVSYFIYKQRIGWQALGVASTLMALPPVIILPVSYFGFKDEVGWQAILGTLLAIAGVAILLLA